VFAERGYFECRASSRDVSREHLSHSDRVSERESERQRERNSLSEKDIERDAETERQRDRETERERESQWYGHLRRHLDSPAGLALAFSDAKWLQGRRIKEQSRANRACASLLGNAGWTATRVVGLGRPQPRWEEH
jgi:hypothetical protein